MEKRLILMLGLPGSGKSTYVHNILVPQGVQVVNPDAIRLAFGHRFYGPLEAFIHALSFMQARQLMLQGFDVVIDESTCRAEYLQRWKRLAEDMGYTASAVHVPTPADVCRQRRAEDGADFPLEVIDRKQAELHRDWDEILALFPDMVTALPDYCFEKEKQQENDA